MIRTFPPVHSVIGLSSMLRAVRAHLDAGPVEVQAREALSRLFPSRSHILLDSGTSALVLALQATRPDGAPPVVALPGYCCPDVASAAIGAGYSIVLYDLDPLSLAPDLPSLRHALRCGATHVVLVHFYGIIQDVDAVASAIGNPDVTIIEDAAQAAGGSRLGIQAGGQAALGIMSFGRGKGINAGGGGALLVSGNFDMGSVAPVLSSKFDSFRSLGSTAATSLLSNPWIYGLPRVLPGLGIGETHYVPAGIPRSASLTTQVLLPSAIAENARSLPGRRLLAAFYDAEFDRGLRVRALGGQDRGDGGALRFAVRVSRAEDRLRFESLARLGVVRSYPRTLAAYPEIRAAIHSDGPLLRGADELAETTFTLPTHGGISERVAGQIVRALEDRP